MMWNLMLKREKEEEEEAFYQKHLETQKIWRPPAAQRFL